ncbi:hypothetical protein BP5796_10826 [Coleophoma crateriformis]|uniref:CENP-V/GFA domain-containing protein n=1 Tax=Coleophoma crateriformis TaxID=565419 RepID=A0A3D8QM39_9HELO|nr:hypothetical protein BP5796_10826 [Coleophoma crateriformis]
MSSLPETPFTLHGGCNCKALRYTFPVPALASRPIVVPASADAGHGDIRLPMFNVDHCNDCRRASGSLTNFWMVAPRSDLSFQCLLRDGGEERIQLSGDELLFPSPASEKTFIVHYKSSHNDTFGADCIRAFCGRCGTMMSTGYFPWQLPIVAACSVQMGTLDREDLEKDGVRLERHLCCENGIDWVVKMVSEGDKGLQTSANLPKHPSWNMSDVMH